jgi:hypothetical protein
MLFRVAGSLLIVAMLTVASGPARGQVSVSQDPVRLNNEIYAAPGGYGMMWGSPSYGSIRTYTEFSSPYGLGYGYGYAPYGFLPGRYGVGLWRPGLSTYGYVYGAAPYYGYRTFPVPYDPTGKTPAPPVGAYAPAFGPGSYLAH